MPAITRTRPTVRGSRMPIAAPGGRVYKRPLSGPAPEVFVQRSAAIRTVKCRHQLPLPLGLLFLAVYVIRGLLGALPAAPRRWPKNVLVRDLRLVMRS